MSRAARRPNQRLEQRGWKPRPASPATLAIEADALALGNPPEPSDPAAWKALRAWARELTAENPPQLFYGSGSALVRIEVQDQTGWPMCGLMTLRSRESELILQALENSGGVISIDGIRRGEMFSVQSDAQGADWRTDISLVSVGDEAAETLFNDPLATTLTATFVTQPAR